MCSRLAPIFSISELIINALLDISSNASLLKIISTSSDLIKAVYCLVREFLGSDNILRKSIALYYYVEEERILPIQFKKRKHYIDINYFFLK